MLSHQAKSDMKFIGLLLLLVVIGATIINACVRVPAAATECWTVEAEYGWDYESGKWYNQDGYLMGTAPTEDSVIKQCSDAPLY